MTTSLLKGSGFIAVAALVAAAVTVVGATAQQTPPVSRVRDAEAIVDAMVAGDFTSVVSRFDATMKAALTEAALRNGWVTTATQVGKLVRRAPAKEERRGQYVAVLIPCEFERGRLEVTVVFDPSGAVAGLSMRPPAAPYVLPAYATPASYTEREVIAGSGDWPLPGTLTTPSGPGPFPAVVLVHGSGPNDRGGQTRFRQSPR